MKDCARGDKCINPAGSSLPDHEFDNSPLCACCIRDRRQTREQLEQITPQQWEERIAELYASEETKHVVTKIVWWDFAGVCVCAGLEWDTFIRNEIMSFPGTINRDEVVRCLDELGFWDAEHRVTWDEVKRKSKRIQYVRRDTD